MPTLPPPYPDNARSPRRISVDSDSYNFPPFSLTPESEVALRSWEQIMLGSATPAPTPTPTPSENPPPATGQPSRCWVVFKGRAPGIYTTT